ncbi:MAG: ribonuclease J [Acidobacteriota bacterium]|nr:ribonuclease J [Acidobacteriota bacterium]MDQ7087931.1 ribonuclease J [Acidobacteriota bacterium]
MNSALEIVSVGGSGGFGQNATLLVWERVGLLIDFGIGFPRGAPVGATRVVPDAEPLVGRCERLAGIVLTHAHDDHAAGLAWLPAAWQGATVYGSAWTLAAARDRYEQVTGRRLVGRTVDGGQRVECGPFAFHLLPVTHSAPESRAVLIRTPVGSVVHSGDFKLDPRPWRGAPTDFEAFRRLTRGKVRVLMVDSTGARRRGRSRSESEVRPALEEHILGARGQVVVSTFASHLHRLEAVAEVARAAGRRVAPLGQRMNEVLRRAVDMGSWAPPPGLLVSAEELAREPPAARLYLAGGCQGEPGSSLSRISRGDFPGVAVGRGDLLLLSSSTIPGSEVQVGALEDRFLRLGCPVVSARDDPRLHASGHGNREEITEFIARIHPEILLPIHGDRVHLERCAELGRALGAGPGRVEILERGESLLLDASTARRGEGVELSPRVLDDAGRHLAREEIRDRRRLGKGGVVVVRASWDPGREEPRIRSEALGIPQWQGDAGRSGRVEAMVRTLLEGVSRPDPGLEELVARRVSRFLRSGRRDRPQVVVILDPGPALDKQEESR